MPNRRRWFALLPGLIPLLLVFSPCSDWTSLGECEYECVSVTTPGCCARSPLMSCDEGVLGPALLASGCLAAAAVLIAALTILYAACGRKEAPRVRGPPVEQIAPGTWEIRSYAAVSQLPKLAAFDEDYMTVMYESLGPADREKYARLFTFMRAQVLTLSGPPQRELHTLIASFLSPAAVAELRPSLLATLAPLLDDIEHKLPQGGVWDAVQCLAARVPVAVVARLLGIPSQHCADLARWTRVVEEWYGGEGALADRCVGALAAIDSFAALVSPLVTAPPPHTLTAALVAGAVRGAFPKACVIPNLFFLVAAGQETTSALIASSILSVLEHKEEHARVCTAAGVDAARVRAVIQETMRLRGPIRRLYRRVSAPVAVGEGGPVLPPGDFVQFVCTDANTDPAVFPDPLVFDSNRSNSGRHVGFGVGAHTCPGSRLALLEAEVCVCAVFTRWPGLRLFLPPNKLRWARLDSMMTLLALPLTLPPPQKHKRD